MEPNPVHVHLVDVTHSRLGDCGGFHRRALGPGEYRSSAVQDLALAWVRRWVSSPRSARVVIKLTRGRISDVCAVIDDTWRFWRERQEFLRMTRGDAEGEEGMGEGEITI
jgi:hypothetical protein